MNRSAAMRVQRVLALLAIGLVGAAFAGAQGYQRSRPWHGEPFQGGYHASGTYGGHHGPKGSGHSPHGLGGGHHQGGYVAGSYFQRPYPYHLDYYRLRYGGSYAPYFGNQYGVPQVVAPYYAYPPYVYGWPGPPIPLAAPAVEAPVP